MKKNIVLWSKINNQQSGFLIPPKVPRHVYNPCDTTQFFSCEYLVGSNLSFRVREDTATTNFIFIC